MTTAAVNDFNNKCVGDWRLYDVTSWGATLIDKNTGATHDIMANDMDDYRDFFNTVLFMCGYKGNRDDVCF